MGTYTTIILFNCILVIAPIAAVKLVQTPFFNLPKEYNEMPKADFTASIPSHEYSSSDRVLRNIGENNVVCEVSTTVEEFYEDGYEFHPKTYSNETCMNTNVDPYIIHNHHNSRRVICLHNDDKFGCQTLYEEINVWKKSTTGREECLEHESQLVAIGCKCNIRFTNQRG